MQQLGNARLLTMTGDGHTAYDGDPDDGYNSQCADAAVEGYLFTLALPAEGTKCAPGLAGLHAAGRGAADVPRATADEARGRSLRGRVRCCSRKTASGAAAAREARGGGYPSVHGARPSSCPPGRARQRLGGHWRVIVRNDDHNTFDHVAHTLARHVPGVSVSKGYAIADLIHNQGQAVVWSGMKEPAELLPEALERRRAHDGASEQG